MKKRVLLSLLLIIILQAATAAAGDRQVIRRYYDDGLLKDFGTNIILVGCPKHVMQFTRWLDQIARVPKGWQTLWQISNTPHELVIRDSEHARLSAGRTLAPMTMDIINGVGDSVEIHFDARTRDSGSHMVYNARRDLIEYSAIQNLYHELAHAMHMMNGTWRYFDSEAQAIEEENIFRRQLAHIQGLPPTQRYRIDGVLIRDIANPKRPKATTQ
jgi:hypothetical protein